MTAPMPARLLAEVDTHLSSSCMVEGCGSPCPHRNVKPWQARAMLNEIKRLRAVGTQDLAGWSAEENAEFDRLYGPEAAAGLRAANNRVWVIVKELRETAVTEGRDPYRDAMAQRLSAALVGVGPDGICELPHRSTDEEDHCDRRHKARGGTVSADAFPIIETGCTFPMPSRAAVEADSRVQIRRRTPEESRAYLTDHRDEQIAKGVSAKIIDALIASTYERPEK
jgi:hypothetical protein